MPRVKKGQCRFCLENDTLKNLITPCNCKGSAKYIHSTCLSKWSNLHPETGHICKSCLIECQRAYPNEYEPSSITHNLYIRIFLNNPGLLILANHWGFLILAELVKLKHNQLGLYMITQYIIHGIYGLLFLFHILQVKNKLVYSSMWLDPSRLLLIGLHIGFLYTIPKTYLISGISSNICMHMYFYEHYTILDTINEKNMPIFVNRSKKQGRV